MTGTAYRNAALRHLGLSTLGIDDLSWVAAAGCTIAITPFLILLSSLLRIKTAVKQTLAVGPSILQGYKHEVRIN